MKLRLRHLHRVIVACLTILTLATSPSLGAQQKPSSKAAWPQEPSLVFGIPIGKTLPNEKITDCGGTTIPVEERLPFCSRNPGGVGSVTRIENLPIEVFTSGSITRTDLRVDAVQLTSRHDNYQQVRAILIERYGKPTSSEVVEIKTKVGASFKSEVLSWKGRNMTLTLYERHDTIDSSVTLFLSNVGANEALIRQGIEVKNAASKM